MIHTDMCSEVDSMGPICPDCPVATIAMAREGPDNNRTTSFGATNA